MSGTLRALWLRYGKDNVNLSPDGHLYIRSVATSGRYVWHFMEIIPV